MIRTVTNKELKKMCDLFDSLGNKIPNRELTEEELDLAYQIAFEYTQLLDEVKQVIESVKIRKK